MYARDTKLSAFNNMTLKMNAVLGLRIYPNWTPHEKPCDTTSPPAAQTDPSQIDIISSPKLVLLHQETWIIIPWRLHIVRVRKRRDSCGKVSVWTLSFVGGAWGETWSFHTTLPFNSHLPAVGSWLLLPDVTRKKTIGRLGEGQTPKNMNLMNQLVAYTRRPTFLNMLLIGKLDLNESWADPGDI